MMKEKEETNSLNKLQLFFIFFDKSVKMIINETTAKKAWGYNVNINNIFKKQQKEIINIFESRIKAP